MDIVEYPDSQPHWMPVPCPHCSTYGLWWIEDGLLAHWCGARTPREEPEDIRITLIAEVSALPRDYSRRDYGRKKKEGAHDHTLVADGTCQVCHKAVPAKHFGNQSPMFCPSGVKGKKSECQLIGQAWHSFCRYTWIELEEYAVVWRRKHP